MPLRERTGPKPTATQDHDGKPVYLVPLSGDTDRTAKIYPEDYLKLQTAEGVGKRWHWNAADARNAYVRAHRRCPKTSSYKKVVVARLIVDATKGQTVLYRDHDPTNLRRDNLMVISKADHLKAVTKRKRERRQA